MGVARNGFFNRVQRSVARFFAHNQSRCLEVTGLFLAFCVDAFSLWQTISGNENKTRDMVLSITPATYFFLGTLLSCCFPCGGRREGGVGSSAVSYLGNAGYLISRTAIDLSLTLFVRDYNDPSQCRFLEDLIIDSSECGIELVYILYVFFENKLIRRCGVCLSNALADDPQYAAVPFEV